MINSDTPRTSYTLSSDATTSSTYATPAPIYGADDVKVYVNNVLQTSSSPQQYSVTVASDNTATISFTSSHLPVSGAVIVIIRSLAYLQESNFVNNDALDIENVETGLDKVTVLAQQLADGKDYSFKFASYLSGTSGFNSTPDTASTISQNKANRLNKILGFDASGDIQATQEIGTYKGNWTTATSYSARDLIKQSSDNDGSTKDNVYICKTSHASTGTHLTQNDTANWELILDVATATGGVGESADWARKVDGIVNASTGSDDFSSRAYAIGGTGVTASSGKGAAKEWATTTGGVVDTSEYSAKEYAIGDLTATGGSAKSWAVDASSPDGTSEKSAKTLAAEAAADVVLTHADVVLTNADVVSTGDDVDATNADVISAEAAKAAAELALDTFDDRFLGSKSSAPTVDNDGATLLEGALYWNSTSKSLFVWDGSAWVNLKTAVDGDTITSSDGNNLTLATDENGENVIINSGDKSIKLPNVRATEDNHVLSMKDKTTGETEWKAVAIEPSISAVTWYSDSSYSTVLDPGQEVNINPSPTVTSGTLGSGGTIRKITSITTTNISIGDTVTGTGIGTSAVVSSVDASGGSNDGTITLSVDNTGSGSQSLTFTPTEASISYLKVGGAELGDSGAFNTTAYVQIINTSQSSIVVGDNSSGLTGCVTAATHTSSAEWKFTINPTGVSNIAAGDVLKVKVITNGGDDIFTSGYTVSADPTSTTTVSSAVVANTASVGSFGGLVAGGGTDDDTKLLLNFDRANGSTDFEDSSNVGGHGHKVIGSGNVHIDNTIGAFNGTSSGKVNNCSAYFDGAGDYLTVNNTTNIVSVNSIWSLDFWIYPLANTDYGYIVDSRDAASEHGYRLYLTTTGAATDCLSLDLGYAASTAVRLSTSLELGTWTHVAIQQTGEGSGTTLKGYFDGVQVYTDEGPDYDWGVGGSTTWIIGSRHSKGDHFLKGYLDSFRLCFANDSFTGAFDKPTSIYGVEASTTINSIGLLGAAGADSGDHYVIYNTATLSGSTESTVALPSGLSISPAVGATSTTNAATISGNLTATAGTHAIKLVARVSSNGSAAKIDPNRKTAYTHTITKNAGTLPEFFNVRRYQGNDLARKITGFGFQPDLVWAKRRGGTNGHALFDSVRGTGGYLDTAEDAGVDAKDNMVTDYDTDGVSLGTDSTAGMINYNDKSFVMWGWKAGGEVSSDGGSQTHGYFRLNGEATDRAYNTYTVPAGSGYAHGKSMHTGSGGGTTFKSSYNTNAGITITETTAVGNASWNTFPNLLGGGADMVIVKRLDAAGNWNVWHKDSINNPSNSAYRANLHLDTNASGAGSLTVFGSDAAMPGDGARTYTIGSHASINASATDARYIHYIFRSVAGVSKFGKYTGNGNDYDTHPGEDCDFFPRMLIVKRVDSTGHWHISDFVRSSSTISGDALSPVLWADEPDSEKGVGDYKFKLYESGSTKGFRPATNEDEINADGGTYIYAAFA